MKLRCRNCNTAFDYDKYEGYCPKCGSYNEKPVKADRGRTRKPAAAGSRRRRKFNLTTFMVLLLVLIPAIGIPTARAIAVHNYKQVRDQVIETTEIAVGETIRIHDYEYTTLKVEWHALNETRNLLQIEFKLKYLGDRYHEGEYLAPKTRIYLYADGEYKRPYDGAASVFHRLLPEGDPYKDQIYKDGYTGTFNRSTGSLAFLVPDDAEEVYFLIVVYDDDLFENVVRYPVQKWKLPIPVGEVSE